MVTYVQIHCVNMFTLYHCHLYFQSMVHPARWSYYTQHRSTVCKQGSGRKSNKVIYILIKQNNPNANSVKDNTHRET